MWTVTVFLPHTVPDGQLPPSKVLFTPHHFNPVARSFLCSPPPNWGEAVMSLATTMFLCVTTSKTMSDSVEHVFACLNPCQACSSAHCFGGHHSLYSSSSYFICIAHFQHKLYKVLHKLFPKKTCHEPGQTNLPTIFDSLHAYRNH